jgi:hypothetical protein
VLVLITALSSYTFRPKKYRFSYDESGQFIAKTTFFLRMEGAVWSTRCHDEFEGSTAGVYDDDDRSMLLPASVLVNHTLI